MNEAIILQQKIDDYFSSLDPVYQYDENGEIITDKSGIPAMTERLPATVSSLAYAIGCSSRKDFEKMKSSRKYKRVIDRALLRLEAYTERMLFDKASSAGAKFLLENDFGRNADMQESKDSGGVVILADIRKEADKK